MIGCHEVLLRWYGPLYTVGSFEWYLDIVVSESREEVDRLHCRLCSGRDSIQRELIRRLVAYDSPYS